MSNDKIKIIQYKGLSSGRIKYPVNKIVIGTIIKASGPYYRVKTDLGKIVEIAKDKVLDIIDQ